MTDKRRAEIRAMVRKGRPTPIGIVAELLRETEDAEALRAAVGIHIKAANEWRERAEACEGEVRRTAEAARGWLVHDEVTELPPPSLFAAARTMGATAQAYAYQHAIRPVMGWPGCPACEERSGSYDAPPPACSTCAALAGTDEAATKRLAATVAHTLRGMAPLCIYDARRPDRSPAGGPVCGERDLNWCLPCCLRSYATELEQGAHT